jgi:uncharacterized protein YegP (UPF0339 family)
MKIEVYRDAGGNFRWRLRAANGLIIAASGESFSSKAAAIRAAESIRDNASSASVVEV